MNPDDVKSIFRKAWNGSDAYQWDDKSTLIEELVRKFDANKTYGQTSAAPKAPPPPFSVVKKFENPSQPVYAVNVRVLDIKAYLFAEYTHGKDWYEAGDLYIVTEKVLVDLNLRFSGEK